MARDVSLEMTRNIGIMAHIDAGIYHCNSHCPAKTFHRWR